MRFIYNPLVIMAFSVVAGLFYFSLTKTEQKMRSSTETITVLDQEVSKIASEISDLENELKEATSTATREKIIRNELLMKKENEYVVQLPPLEENQEPGEENSKMQTWQEWWELITRNN